MSPIKSSTSSGLLSRLSSNTQSNQLRLRSNPSSLRSQPRSVVTSLPDDQSIRRSPPKRMCYTKVDPSANEMEEEEEGPQSSGGFVSARNQYIVDQQKKFGKSYNPNADQYNMFIGFIVGT